MEEAVLGLRAPRTAGDEDVVGPCPGDVEDGAAGSVHTQTVRGADLLPGATRVDVAIYLCSMSGGDGAQTAGRASGAVQGWGMRGACAVLRAAPAALAGSALPASLGSLEEARWGGRTAGMGRYLVLLLDEDQQVWGPIGIEVGHAEQRAQDRCVSPEAAGLAP